MAGPRLAWAGVAVAALPLVGGLTAHFRDAAPLETLQWVLVGYALAGLPYLYVWRHWQAWSAGRRGLVQLLLLVAATRAILLVLPPILSEDVWRYLWDGLVQGAGINPYRFAPDDAALNGVSAAPGVLDVRASVGHGAIPTIYPPFAQWVFAATALAGPHLAVMRGVIAAADVLTVWGLWRWAGAAGRPPQIALLYALCPLAVMESSVGAHVDVLALAPTVWGGWALTQSRWGRAGVALALGAGAKLLPVIAAPWLLLRGRARVVGAAALTLVVLALPYVGAGRLAFRGLAAYGARWRGNDGLFALFVAGFEQIWPASAQPVDLPGWAVQGLKALVGTVPGGDPARIWPDEAAFAAAKGVALLLFAAIWLWLTLRARTVDGFFGPVTLALFLLAPVVHPWYLLWPLAFAALSTPGDRPPAWATAARVWALTAWLAYLPRMDWLSGAPPTWHGAVGWRLLEYVPVFAVLALAAARRYKIRPPRRA